MKYGLVLAGGGVRGAYQVGVWEALQKLGIKVSAVSGASIGAVNGALFVQGDCKTAKKLWQGITLEDIVTLPDGMKKEDNLFRFKNFADIAAEICKNSGLDMSPFERLLYTVIDEKKLRKSPVDFGISAFSVTKKNAVYKFKEDIPQGRIVEYLMASACIPGFKPKAVEADRFLDGGVSNNMPVNMLIEKDIDNIITVDVKGVGVYRSFNLAGRNIISIRCEKPQTGIMEFDKTGIERSMDEGYIDCMKAFGRVEGDIYSFDAADYRKARMKYSKELIEGVERAAKAFDVDTIKIYTVDELIRLTMDAYNSYSEKSDIAVKESVFDKIRQADDNAFVAWLVKILESGKSDFVKGRMSVLGENYDAASAIMYFKNQK